MIKKTYNLKAKVWLYPGMAGWHFVTLPKDTSEEIDYFFSTIKKGWGSVSVTVTVGETVWNSSIFPDKKSGSYILPLKATVRKKEHIKESDLLDFTLDIPQIE